MKELVFIIACLQLTFILAATKKQKLTKDLPKDVVFQTKIERFFIPETNSLFEIDVSKGFYPEVLQNVRRKRNVVEPVDPPAGLKKRRRRRRKKVRTDKPRERVQSEKQMFAPPINEQLNPPLDNILDPSQFRRPSLESLPIHQEPMLSEVNEENPNDGLLKVKQLQSQYIKADMMQTNKLKADKIKADQIKAKEVVVTAKRRGPSSGGGRKRRRRPRPSPSEFIQQGPVYERIGRQRVNSLDSRLLEQALFAQDKLGPQNPFGIQELDNIPLRRVQRRRKIRKPKVDNRYVRTERLQTQPFQDPSPVDMYAESLPAIQPEVPFPEFSSTKVLKKVPALSEFIAGPSIRSKAINSQNIQPRVFENPKPTAETFGTEFHLFDGPLVNEQVGADIPVDKTSKTYATKVDPWFF